MLSLPAAKGLPFVVNSSERLLFLATPQQSTAFWNNGLLGPAQSLRSKHSVRYRLSHGLALTGECNSVPHIQAFCVVDARNGWGDSGLAHVDAAWIRWRPVHVSRSRCVSRVVFLCWSNGAHSLDQSRYGRNIVAMPVDDSRYPSWHGSHAAVEASRGARVSLCSWIHARRYSVSGTLLSLACP